MKLFILAFFVIIISSEVFSKNIFTSKDSTSNVSFHLLVGQARTLNNFNKEKNKFSALAFSSRVGSLINLKMSYLSKNNFAFNVHINNCNFSIDTAKFTKLLKLDSLSNYYKKITARNDGSCDLTEFSFGFGKSIRKGRFTIVPIINVGYLRFQCQYSRSIFLKKKNSNFEKEINIYSEKDTLGIAKNYSSLVMTPELFIQYSIFRGKKTSLDLNCNLFYKYFRATTSFITYTDETFNPNIKDTKSTFIANKMNASLIGYGVGLCLTFMMN